MSSRPRAAELEGLAGLSALPVRFAALTGPCLSAGVALGGAAIGLAGMVDASVRR